MKRDYVLIEAGLVGKLRAALELQKREMKHVLDSFSFDHATGRFIFEAKNVFSIKNGEVGNALADVERIKSCLLQKGRFSCCHETRVKFR